MAILLSKYSYKLCFQWDVKKINKLYRCDETPVISKKSTVLPPESIIVSPALGVGEDLIVSYN